MSKFTFLLVASALLVAVAAQENVVAEPASTAAVNPVDGPATAPEVTAAGTRGWGLPAGAAKPQVAAGAVGAQTISSTSWVSKTVSTTIAAGSSYTVTVDCNSPTLQQASGCACKSTSNQIFVRSFGPEKSKAGYYPNSNTAASACSCVFSASSGTGPFSLTAMASC